MPEQNVSRALVEFVIDLKERELCTTPDALLVVRECRALLEMEQCARKELPGLPTFDLSHLRSFAYSIRSLASILLDLEVLRTLAVNNQAGDPLEIVPPIDWISHYLARPYPALDAMIRLDYGGLFVSYADLIAAQHPPMEAFGELTTNFLAGKRLWYHLPKQSVPMSLGEAVECLVGEYPKEAFTSKAAKTKLRQKITEQELSMMSLVLEYHPNLEGAPESLVEIDSGSLYRRALNDGTLNRLEVERKIALAHVRGTVRELARIEKIAPPGVAHEVSLDMTNSSLASAIEDLAKFQRLCAPDPITQPKEARINELKYLAKVLGHHRRWLIDVLTR